MFGIDHAGPPGRAGGPGRATFAGEQFGFFRHEIAQTIKKPRLFNRLHQKSIDSRPAPGFRVQPQPQRSEHHQPCLDQRGVGPDGLREGEAIHFGHLQVQNHHLE